MAVMNSRHKLSLLASYACLVCVVMICTPQGAQAALASVKPIDQLVSESAAIVEGRLAYGQPVQTPGALVIEVTRSLRGEVQEGAVITAWVEVPDLNVSSEMTGIWFLKQGSSSQAGWIVVPTMSGQPTENDLLLPISVSSDAMDRDVGVSLQVALSLCESMTSFGNETPSGLINANLFEILGMYADHPQLAECWERRVQVAGGDGRVVAVAGLIRAGDQTGIDRLLQQLEEFEQSRAFPLIVTAIADRRLTDPDALSKLGALGTRDGPMPEGLAFAVAYSLRQVHLKEVLPFLVELLDHDDLHVRYQAVAGMASFAAYSNIPVEQKIGRKGQFVSSEGGPYANAETAANFPTLKGFREDPSRYTSFWKGWWSREQAVIQERQ